jgi:class 3 adenylate cyclase/tetratricopeptide (TPR) repeat protein
MRAAHVAGERKVVTVLFADVVSSTSLSRQVGAEDWTAIMNQAFERLCPAIEHAGGTLARLMGDALLAFFGAPLAREDDPLRAVSAAVDLLQNAREYAAEVHAAYHIEFAVRVGICTGPVVLGDVGSELLYEYTAMGDAVNLAARLQAATSPMTALMSEETYRAVHDAVRCEDLGRLKVKGIGEPVRVYRALGLMDAAAQGRDSALRESVPLVGRSDELAAIREHLADLGTGIGGLIVMVGEPGVGKSRLLAEVRNIAAAAGFVWLQGHAPAFGPTISYWPFVEMLAGAIGITDIDTAAASWEKLVHWAGKLLGADAEELVPYLAVLLAIEVPEARVPSDNLRPQVFRAMRRVVNTLARECPTVFAVEDVHWLDDSTSDLLEHLLPLGNQLPFLVIATARPEESPALIRLRERARSHARHGLDLTLRPLGDDDGVQLVAHLLDIDKLPPGLFPHIAAKADGNPLFMEEIVRSLIDQHALVQEPSGHGWQAIYAPHQLAIPDTIQGVLQARLDRLEPGARETLRIASVIGRTFFQRLLAAVANAGNDLDTHVERLKDLDLIRERRRSPELELMFKHALIQDVAYASMLVRRRRELHNLVAASIETLFADRLDEFCAVLAYHYGRAEEWEKAREYLFKAGNQAGRLAADSEALAHYQQALEAHGRVFGDRWDPVERATLERNMGQALMRRADYQAARHYLKSAVRHVGGVYPDSGPWLRLTILVQAIRQVFHRLAPWSLAVSSTGQPADEERARIYDQMMNMEYLLNIERSAAVALLTLNDGEATGVAYGIAMGSTAVALICDTIGAFGWAASYHRRALAAASRTDNARLLGLAHFGTGFHHEYVGNCQLALEYYERAADILWRIGELRLWATARVRACALIGWCGDFATAVRQLEEVIQVTRDSGDGAPRAWAEGLQGYFKAIAGDLDAGIRAQEAAVEFLDRLPDYHGAIAVRGGLAQSYLWKGALAEAQAVLDVARASINRNEVRGMFCAPVILAEAEADLLRARSASAGNRRALVDRVRRGCLGAIAGHKVVGVGRSAAYRIAGTCEWLRDNPEEARRLWQLSIDEAQTMGAKVELAVTLVEMGGRLGQKARVEEAEALLRTCEAELIRHQAEEVLVGMAA